MRYLLNILFFAALLLGAPTEWAKSLDDAKRIAAAEGKLVYVLITEPGCRWCKRFKRTTLHDHGVRRRLDEMAVGVEVERGSGTYPDTLKALMIPMHYFLSPDERVLVKMPGYWNIEDFMSILDDVERKRK
ncbi:thioredoxin family protein [Sulfurimonas diazotrophicus]|uniref:Thioredoxin family protein n=1 Tax=Sulfurimonas diazotrophicus TaxID=3131939 RepID=A0ABZ3HDM2_9BACT